MARNDYSSDIRDYIKLSWSAADEDVLCEKRIEIIEKISCLDGIGMTTATFRFWNAYDEIIANEF